MTTTPRKQRAGGNRAIDPGSRKVTSFFMLIALIAMAALAWSVSRDRGPESVPPVATPVPAPDSAGAFDPLTGTLQRAEDAAALSGSRKQALDEAID